MLLVPPIIEEVYDIRMGDNRTLIPGDVRHKNVRVKFPNGERADITNTSIVSESFSFTESVCSTDSFKFGLCEAAEVSFETVGVENIIGCKIDVWYEIDVSDMENAGRQASGCYTEDDSLYNDSDYSRPFYTPDRTSTYGKQCVNNKVYAIPFGVFTVESCQRSKSDMTHREIHAITRVFETNDDMTPFEQWRISQMHKKKWFYMDIPQYIDCQTEKMEDYSFINSVVDAYPTKSFKNYMFYVPTTSKLTKPLSTEKIFYRDTRTATEVKESMSDSTMYMPYKGYISLSCGNGVADNDNGSTNNITLNYPYLIPGGQQGSESKVTFTYTKNKLDRYKIYRMEINDKVVDINGESVHIHDSVDSFSKYIKYMINDCSNKDETGNRIDARGIPLRSIKFDQFFDFPDSDYDPEKGIYHDRNAMQEFIDEVIYRYGFKYSDKVYNQFSALTSPYILPYDNGTSTTGTIIRPLCFKLALDTFYRFPYIWGAEIHENTFVFHIALYGISPLMCSDNTSADLTIRYQHTLDAKKGTYRYSFYNAFSMHDLISGYLEINALFGHQRRDGSYGYIKLTGTGTSYLSYDASIPPDNYEELYYDEYDIDDVGGVAYSYTNKTNDTMEETLSLGNGGTSIYDMTDNSFFEALDKDESISDAKLKAQIVDLLNNKFVPNLTILKFTPVEATIHAKPWLEAGDRYKIITRSGEEFYTYNLSSTFSGIQDPKHEIVSTSGQMIDGVVTNTIEEEDDDEG